MKGHIKISRNVLAELSRAVAEHRPVLSTDHGDLFPSDVLPLAAVRLKVPTADYFGYLTSLPADERPSLAKIVPVDGLPFHIVIDGFVSVEAGRTAVDGKRATII